ncbi:MAG: glycosyltransferase family 4 protein [Vicinamibacteria bacterium]
MRVDQWTPALHRGDAIGDSTLLMRDALRSWGYQSDVYALTIEGGLQDEARPFASFRPGAPEDVVIAHFALPSPLTAALRAHRGRRVLIHHNVTPPEFFLGWDPELARICAEGRQELASLAGHVELGLGDSEFNRRELEALGFGRTGVLPICLDFARYREAPNPVLLRQLRDGRTNLLFVGRVAPNKRPDDLIRVATCYKRFVSSNLRLLIVGRLPRRETGHGDPLPKHYFDALQAFFYEAGFTPEEVVFSGHVSHDELLACYRAAGAFLCLSEHEGFGVPLVEAMLLDVPVVAYRTTAVADTLGDAGVQLGEKRFDEIAELLGALATDAALRAGVLRRQRARAAEFAPERVLARLRAHVESLEAGA